MSQHPVALVLSWAGLAAAIFVNVASCFGIGLINQFSFLHFGFLGLAIFAVRVEKKRKASAALGGAPDRWSPWVGSIALFSFLYFVINFVALFFLSDGGSPSVEDGQYVLQSHGRLIRTLTEPEYRWQVAHVSRMFSSCWMMFYSVFIGVFSTSYSPNG